MNDPGQSDSRLPVPRFDPEGMAVPPRPAQNVWANPPGAQGISYGQLAWKHKGVLFCLLLLGGLGGTVYVTLKTPRYLAATTVELVGLNQSFMNMSQVDPQAGTDTTSASASNIQTQSRILTSRSMLTRVVERMRLEMTPVSAAPATIFAQLRARIPYGQKEPLEQTGEALGLAQMTVSARGVGATRLIEIQCESTSPEVAANFLNTLAAEHISQSLAARSNTTQRTSQWMEGQLEEAKARLQQAGEKLREFVQRSGMDFFPEQSTLADSKLKQLQADVAHIQADRIAKQAKWELTKTTPLDSLADVLNDGNLQNIKGRISDLRREIAQLTATLTPENYRVTRIQAQVTELEQTLEKEKAGLLKRVENDYQEALRREKLLSGAYHAQTRAVGAQADKSSQYAMLKRDVDMAQQVYNMLLQQSNQAALVALAPASNIRVVDPALPVPIPSSPRPARDIPMGALAGGGFGYGLLLLREMRRRKKLIDLFDAPGHTRTVLGVPELGVIPSAVAQPARAIEIFRAPHRVWRGREPQQLEFATFQDKSSMLAESFRQTLTSILRARPGERSPLYVITSVGPAEGKTTLSANLAIAMADIGQRVLLIDADLRRARLHKVFGLEDRKGLSDLLTEPGPLAGRDLREYLQTAQVKNLTVMTSGLAAVETPALLYFSPRLQELRAALAGQFDYVLLDTAPALQFPDARLWGKHATGVILIIRAGVTAREPAMAVCNRFTEDGIPVLGTILNDWLPKEQSRYDYSYGYSAAPGKPARRRAGW